MSRITRSDTAPRYTISTTSNTFINNSTLTGVTKTEGLDYIGHIMNNDLQEGESVTFTVTKTKGPGSLPKATKIY